MNIYEIMAQNVAQLVQLVVLPFSYMVDLMGFSDLFERDINLYLFSDNLIFTATIAEILFIIFMILIYVLVLRFIYKVIKRIISIVTLVF